MCDYSKGTMDMSDMCKPEYLSKVTSENSEILPKMGPNTVEFWNIFQLCCIM
jgi:hypothetical protein